MRTLIKLIIMTLFVLCTATLVVAAENSTKPLPLMPTSDKFTAQNYPVEGIHKKLGLTCTDCHRENKPEAYSSEMLGSCLKCHDSYEKIKERTGHLGHNNNVHQSPHFENLACDVCHKSHSKPLSNSNLCVQCHGQNTMKQLLVK
ncbi:cytochrome c3 family protein [Sulfurospirillum arsenophilum]|uniref:cytochrome c3 family protein n=1 Tax=Sulfurospirillum arsenophilum TaxID=56698 RepID=UPI000694F4A2|nr:cytochrome c3 family protein [Sulfurospirillum arsenophilum]